MDAEWRKSSRCETRDCVEVRQRGDQVDVRDSVGGPVLTFPRQAWAVFIEGAKRGDFDPASVR